MATFISNSPEATLELGRRWGRELSRGWVIGLTGDLGAGKTQLVKGIALGLGISGRVSSPSFGLVNEYETGREPFHHLDLYRLDTPEQIVAAGLEPYLIEPVGITVVEWVDRWLDGSRPPPRRFRNVRISILSETGRSIEHEDTGD